MSGLLALGGPAGWTSFDSLIVLTVNVAIATALIFWWLRRNRQEFNRRLDTLDELLARVQDEWRYQHQQATYVGTIEGYWRVLEIGIEEGGLPLHMRKKIYDAGDEMFKAFHRGQLGERARVTLWK